MEYILLAKEVGGGRMTCGVIDARHPCDDHSFTPRCCGCEPTKESLS